MRFFLKKEYSSTKHNSLEMIYIDGDALQEIYFEHNCSSLVLVVWEGENVERERVKRLPILVLYLGNLTAKTENKREPTHN